MPKFPKIFKFKKLCRKLRREKILTPYKILLYCNDTEQFKNELNKLTKRSIEKISYLTKDQANSEDWFYFRKNVITGTLVKRIITAVKKDKNDLKINKAITKKHYTKLYYPAILYGVKNEKEARNTFWQKFKKNHTQPYIKLLGFTLHSNFILGGSPDFLYGCSCCENSVCVGEIKCPWKLRDLSVLENIDKLEYITPEGKLKNIHSYMYQVQTYLGILKLKKAKFIVWSKIDFLAIDIEFDPKIWSEILETTEKYYFGTYLPHIFKK